MDENTEAPFQITSNRLLFIFFNSTLKPLQEMGNFKSPNTGHLKSRVTDISLINISQILYLLIYLFNQCCCCVTIQELCVADVLTHGQVSLNLQSIVLNAKHLYNKDMNVPTSQLALFFIQACYNFQTILNFG